MNSLVNQYNDEIPHQSKTQNLALTGCFYDQIYHR